MTTPICEDEIRSEEESAPDYGIQTLENRYVSYEELGIEKIISNKEKQGLL